ncbi:hypothetical protein C5913_004188 [Escherichia coli O13]|nr:hypothetical protein [Escherichia coli O13]
MIDFGGDAPGAYLPVAVVQLHLRHPKANYSLVPAFRRDNPINVKEPANLFRLASSVLLMAKEYCRYFIVQIPKVFIFGEIMISK